MPELGGYHYGEWDLATAIEKMAQSTRRYAKRQVTWIRGRMAEWERVSSQSYFSPSGRRALIKREVSLAFST
jgi:tRNA A37 N6-isopentenylltransferase MiaA